MIVGFSTGNWAPFRDLKEIETQDYGKRWFGDGNFTPEETEAIWVVLDPQNAPEYLSITIGSETEEFLFQIDLTGATPVLQREDGRILYIRKEVKRMVSGYSTHGFWAPLKELKGIEVGDRGNPWFDDTRVDVEGMEGIWVSLDPRDAIKYLFVDSELEPEGYQEALRCPEKYLVKVDLTGATPVLEDGDGGTLYIRRKGGGKNVERTNQRTIGQGTQAL